MYEINNSNPFKDGSISIGKELKVSDIVRSLQDVEFRQRELTGKFYVNDSALIFETKVKLEN